MLAQSKAAESPNCAGNHYAPSAHLPMAAQHLQPVEVQLGVTSYYLAKATLRERTLR